MGPINKHLLFLLLRTDGPYERSVRTVRTDAPYGRSVRTVRTPSVRTVRTEEDKEEMLSYGAHKWAKCLVIGYPLENTLPTP